MNSNGRGGRAARIGGALAAIALALALSAGCSSKSTAPAPGGRVYGTVRTPTGTPVPDVDVTLTEITSTLAALQLVVADTAGRFEFTGQRPATYVIYSHDFSGHSDADTVVVPDLGRNVAAETVSVVLTLRPSAVLRGTATLAGLTNSAGVALIVDHLLVFGATDTTGAYLIPDVPPGTWVVRASHAGFADATTGVVAPAPDTVNVPPMQLQPGTPSARLTRR